jgi:hypothetical protein
LRQNNKKTTNQKLKQLTMKKLTKAVLAIIVVASSITACKKGDEDPGFSLKSRKGRLSQEWNVTDYKSEVTEIETTNPSLPGDPTVTRTDVITTTYTGNTANQKTVSTTTSAGVSATETTTFTGTSTQNTMTFEKDGTWTGTEIVKWTSRTVQNTTTNTSSIDLTITTTTSGIWYFTGKNKSTEDKKGENLILSTTKSQVKTESRPTQTGESSFTNDVTTTYANNELTAVWHLDRLAKDEIIAMAEMNMNEAGTSSSTTNSVTTSGPIGPDSAKGTVSYTLTVK